MNDSGINVVAFPAPRCVSSRTETFEAGVYWFVTRTRAKNIQVHLWCVGTSTTARGAGNIAFKSTDGGQTWQDISEGLSGKLEEGGFRLSRKIRICQVFYRQDPGQTQSIFVAPTLKGYEK